MEQQWKTGDGKYLKMINIVKKSIVKLTCWKIHKLGWNCQYCSYKVQKDCNRFITQDIVSFLKWLILTKGKGLL